MLDKLNLLEFRQKLEAERADLLRRIDQEKEKLDSPNVINPDRSDLARSYFSRERRSAILTRLEEHFEQVAAAINRLEEGTYGVCVRCGKPISSGRLNALPSAALCMDCQRKLER